MRNSSSSSGFLADELRKLSTQEAEYRRSQTAVTEDGNKGDNQIEKSKYSRLHGMQSSSESSDWSFLLSDAPLMSSFNYTERAANTDEEFRKRQRILRKNTGKSSLKEREVFERVFRDIARGTVDEGRDPSKNKSPKSSGTSQFQRETVVFRNENLYTGQRASGLRYGRRRSFRGDEKDPLKWLSLSSPEVDVNMYPPSLREIAKSLRDIRGDPSEYYHTQDRKADEIEWERKELLKEMLQRMRACDTDLELDGLLEREVYKPFREAAKNFRGQEAQIAPAIARNYPALLLEAMKIMLKTFREAYGALSIFYRARDYGVYSYMLGCTIDVYNQALKIQWYTFEDMFECKNLLEEIVVNGVEANSETIGIVEMMRRQAEERAAASEDGPLKVLTKESDEDGASYRNARFV